LQFVKNYDILHVHGIGFFSDILTLTKFFHKKPLILSTHGGIFHTKKIRLFKNLYFGLWCRLTMKFIDKVIAHSKNDEKLFSEISKPVLIPYSINFDDFSAKKVGDKNTFLYVGRLSKNKRVDRLLEVASYLKKRIPDFRLYIVGDGNERPMLEKKCKDLDLTKNVQFVGEKTGKPLLEYYFRSRIFLSASEYEGFGISVIEAMASGCVAIVNDITAFRNIIADSENGFIIDYSNPKEAAEMVLKICDKKNLSEISRNAKQTAKIYDWKNTMKKTENIYKQFVY
jgi:alpha-1,3-mannosyltransferase